MKPPKINHSKPPLPLENKVEVAAPRSDEVETSKPRREQYSFYECTVDKPTFNDLVSKGLDRKPLTSVEKNKRDECLQILKRHRDENPRPNKILLRAMFQTSKDRVFK